MDKENKLILYKDESGKVSVNTRFADEDVWLTQAQLVGSCQLGKANFREDIKHVLETNSFFCNQVFLLIIKSL